MIISDGHTVIRVITGKGNHSFNGRPRIKPAVITFIKKKKYGFETFFFLTLGFKCCSNSSMEIQVFYHTKTSFIKSIFLR